MGIEGYCAYLSKTNQWMTVGQFYGRTTVPDDPKNYPEGKESYDKCSCIILFHSQ